MQQLAVAFGRALWSQLHWRMLMLTTLPFLVSVMIWGVLLWFGLHPAMDRLHAYFTEHGGFALAGEVLGWTGMSALKAVLVPLIAMWALLPLMILTALLFVAVLAMPLITRFVASRSYPQLERRRGGSLWGSLRVGASSLFIFLVLWLLTLPLALFPPLNVIVQPLLWGWLTYRVMAYDSLADHADVQERQYILQRHRRPLLAIGVITGAMGAAPSLLWLGGAFVVILLPLLAAGAIWLYVLVFVFTGLWFQHYCLQALQVYRAAPPLKDIN